MNLFEVKKILKVFLVYNQTFTTAFPDQLTSQSLEKQEKVRQKRNSAQKNRVDRYSCKIFILVQAVIPFSKKLFQTERNIFDNFFFDTAGSKGSCDFRTEVASDVWEGTVFCWFEDISLFEKFYIFHFCISTWILLVSTLEYASNFIWLLWYDNFSEQFEIFFNEFLTRWTQWVFLVEKQIVSDLLSVNGASQTEIHLFFWCLCSCILLYFSARTTEISQCRRYPYSYWGQIVNVDSLRFDYQPRCNFFFFSLFCFTRK